ncbi:hypothetical protein SKAU_G00410610 [Synaphobranchus kaupii]|uniref:BEN domain-containing protein n=1 Tax=Synaphobranchus kaupii TaxID=118154 RepID=A0A9Q1E7S6_SYNKA|nr:hypothetical protein SKAU_G00410610 [Synaphobranchus kaupii]
MWFALFDFTAENTVEVGPLSYVEEGLEDGHFEAFKRYTVLWPKGKEHLRCPATIIATSARKDSSVPIPAEGQGTTDGFISKELLCLCAKHNAQTFINDLLHGLYTREYMAEHSLTGAKSSVGKDQPKPPIPWKELELITKAAKEHFPSLTDGNIRALIRQKLNNASKIKN